jgi:hypothetical protein
VSKSMAKAVHKHHRPDNKTDLRKQLNRSHRRSVRLRLKLGYLDNLPTEPKRISDVCGIMDVAE